MAEVFFYHLQGHGVPAVLPALIEKSLERGWRVAVQMSSKERLEALDQHLWTYRDDSFLPHGTDLDSDGALQPVLLTLSEQNRNAAEVRFLIDGVPLPVNAASYRRIVLIFDGEDPDAVAAARLQWHAAKQQAFALTYWQADAVGRWQRRTEQPPG